MAVTSFVFGPAGQSLLAGQVGDVAVAGALKAMLLTSTYVKNQDARYKSELTNEVVGTNYVAGGKALTGVVVTYDAATNKAKLDCDDVTFDNVTVTARYAVFYRDTGVATTSPLLVLWDFGADVVATTSPFVLEIAATDGLLNTVPV